MTVFAGAERLTGATAPAGPSPERATVDLTALTAARLRELCEERGIDAPRKATKAQLTALLAE